VAYISASLVQIAVPLASTSSAQTVLDACCPGVFDVDSPTRVLMAASADPYTPTHAVGQGRVTQSEYLQLAAQADGVSCAQATIGVWQIDGGGVESFIAPQGGQTLWDALDIVPVEYP